VILIYACNSKEKGLYEFDPRTLEENGITLSEIADGVSYIPLDNSFPLEVISSNIIFTNDAIYFPSRDIGILAYNREGKFTSKIGNIGRGPGEYNIYLHFCIDDKSGRVYVADIKNVIKVFSRTGQLLRSFPLTEYGDVIENINFYNSKIFVQYGIQYKNAIYEWIFCDTLGNVIKKQNRHLPIFTTNWGGINPIYMFENRLHYSNAFTDTVFSILPDLTEKPSFIISPGEHRKPRSNLSIEQFMSEKYLGLTNIFETGRFFVIIYNYNKKHYLALIDKHNQESFLISFEPDDSGKHPSSGIINDFDGGSWFFPESYFTEKGREYMVGLQYPYHIKARIASDEFKNSTPKYPEKKKELEKLANSLKETDNPVLTIVRLKK
jgi:hypothetical protein